MSKSGVNISSVLSRQEAEECKNAFDRYDTGKTGYVNLSDLRKLLSEIGQLPNDDELFDLVLKLNLDTSGTIPFQSFIELIELHKKKIHGALDDQGTLDAFGLSFQSSLPLISPQSFMSLLHSCLWRKQR